MRRQWPDRARTQRPARVSWGLFLAVAVSALVWCALPAAAATTQERIKADVRFREGFGLRSDPSFVRALRSSELDSVRAYGTVLTPRERSSLAARFRELAEIRPIIRAYARRQLGAHLGGVFIDQEAGGLFYVGVTADRALHLKRLKSMVPSPKRVRVVLVRHSLRELKRVHHAILRDAQELRHQGMIVYSVSTSERQNVVEVAVQKLSPAVIRLLRKRYGSDRIALVERSAPVPESRTNDSMPLKAGLEIRTPSHPTVPYDYCTAAFTAYKYGGDATPYYQLTAGHCGAEGTTWWHHEISLGVVNDNTYTDGRLTANSESASFPISSDKRSNQLYLESDLAARITRVQAATADVEGEAVCKSGRTTLVSCGQILSRDYAMTTPSGATQIFNLRTADYYSEGGDSGAPVYLEISAGTSQYEAKGIHFGLTCETCATRIYSHVSNALSDLGLDALYTSEAHEVLLDSPTAYYRLGERNSARNSAASSVSGAYKDVGYSSTGALAGDPSADFRGTANDSHMSVPTATSLDLASSFTLEAWLKLNAYVSGPGNGVIYKGPSGGAADHYLNGGNYNFTIQADGTVRFAFQYQDPSDPDLRPSYTVTTPSTIEGKVPLSTWTHIAAVYDVAGIECANRMAIYINGVQRACGPTLGPAANAPWVNTKPVLVGKRADISNTSGLIDEAALYNYALSASRISAHYAAQSSGYKLAVLGDAPAAYYELNEAPWMRDESSGGAHGSYLAYDTTTLGQPGLRGSVGDGDTAAAFAGTARGEVDGTNVYVNRPADFTVEAWVKPASVSSGARTIVSKGATGAHGGNYWLLTNGNDISFWYRTQLASCSTSCTFTNNTITWPSAKNAVVGDWYHVVGVFDKCDFPATTCFAKLYVNGTLEGSKSTKDGGGNILAPATNTAPFRIGAAGTSSPVYSLGGGTVDEVAVYGSVLTEAQITRHYAARQ